MITKLNQLEFNQITGGNNTLSGILAVGAAALFMTARGNNLISNLVSSFKENDTKNAVANTISFTICSVATFALMSAGILITNTVSAAIHTAIDSLSPQPNNTTTNA